MNRTTLWPPVVRNGMNEEPRNPLEPVIPIVIGLPSSQERLIKSNEADNEAEANVAEDQELKVLPENEGEQEKVVEVEDAAIKPLPKTTTIIPMDKRNKQQSRQMQQQQKKEITLANVSKQLEQQIALLS